VPHGADFRILDRHECAARGEMCIAEDPQAPLPPPPAVPRQANAAADDGGQATWSVDVGADSR
jgi:hypothetical protein